MPLRFKVENQTESYSLTANLSRFATKEFLAKMIRPCGRTGLVQILQSPLRVMGLNRFELHNPIQDSNI